MIVLMNMIANVMMPAKMVSLGFLKNSNFKFNNLGLVLGMALKFYINVAKGVKLKTRKISSLIRMFVEVAGETLVGRPFCPHPE